LTPFGISVSAPRLVRPSHQILATSLMEDIDVVFWKFNVCRHHDLVGSGEYFACDRWVGSGGGKWTSWHLCPNYSVCLLYTCPSIIDIDAV